MGKYKIFCVVGKSGSGKGTQVELLEQRLPGLQHVYSGDMLRAFAKSKHPLAKKVDALINKQGKLAPDWLADYLWQTALLTGLTKNYTGVVFEGTPRTLGQAKTLDAVCETIFGSQPLAIYLDISDQEAKRRLLIRLVCKRCGQPVPYQLLSSNPKKCSFCGGPVERRKDDKAKAILNRLRFFRKDVLPALRYYQQQKRLVRVNGEQSAQAVFAELWKKLKYKIR